MKPSLKHISEILLCMRDMLIVAVLILFTNMSFAQKENNNIDSLKLLINTSKKDTSMIKILLETADAYKYISPDSSFKYYNIAINISKEIKNNIFEATVLKKIGGLNFNLGNYDTAYVILSNAKNIFEEANDKKGIADCYNNIGGILLQQGYLDKAITQFEKSLKIREDIGDKKGVAASYNNIGLIYYNQGNFQKAIDNFLFSIKIKEKLGDTSGVSNGYFNIAMVYHSIGDYETALEYNYRFLDIAKKQNNKDAMADCYNNIGAIYYDQGKHDKAIEYFQKFLKFKEKLGSKKEMAGGYTNLGNIHYNMNNIEKALAYYKQALKISEEMGDIIGIANSNYSIGNIYLETLVLDSAMIIYKESLKFFKKSNSKVGISACYLSIGNVLRHQKKYTKATEYYTKAIKIKQEIKDKHGEAKALLNLSVMNIETEQYKSAIKNAKKALTIGNEINLLPICKEAYLHLSNAYRGLGQYKNALDNIYNYIEVKDSLFNETKMKEIESLEAKYQNQKKEQQILNQKNELAIQKAENLAKENQLKQEKTIRYSIIIGLILVVILVLIVYRSFRQKKKANAILEAQKIEIEEKNEELNQLIEEVTAQRDQIEIQKHKVEEINFEVSQSIDYAKRIQNSILPDGQIIKKHFSDHFILFMPRDVVSGDFYWLAEVEENTIIAVADCTGHGVPGAFMSMLGISFLREIVIKEYITHPGVILRKLRKEVINALKQESETKNNTSEMKVQDGMDMVIVSINNKTKMMQFAGANNPLYMIRDGEFTEIKGDKMPISIYYKMDKFKTHDIQLAEGDQLYMFSDGYADQFGGEKGKKFKYKPFKKLLTDNAGKKMSEQKQILVDTFEKWKGDIDQIDDIVILGIKI